MIPAPVTEVIPLDVVPPEAKLVLKKAGYDDSTALAMFSDFAPLFAEVKGPIAEALALGDVTDPTRVTEIKRSREIRLALRQSRIKADHLREQQKADALRRANGIQGLFNVFKALVEPVEEKLERNEKIAERLEAERKDKLNTLRGEEVRAFGADPTFYSLGSMPEETYIALRDGLKSAHESKVAAQLKAEQDRINREKAEAELREVIRLDNIRLKQEAERLEAAAKLELQMRAKERAERDAREKEAADQAAKQKAALEAQLRAQQEAADKEKRQLEAQQAAERLRQQQERDEQKRAADAAQKLQDDILAKERLARLQAEAAVEAERKERELEARRKAEDEARAIRDREEAAKRAAAAPDKAKLQAFAEQVRALVVPELATPAGRIAAASIAASVTKFSNHVSAEADKL